MEIKFFKQITRIGNSKAIIIPSQKAGSIDINRYYEVTIKSGSVIV